MELDSRPFFIAGLYIYNKYFPIRFVEIWIFILLLVFTVIEVFIFTAVLYSFCIRFDKINNTISPNYLWPVLFHIIIM